MVGGKAEAGWGPLEELGDDVSGPRKQQAGPVADTVGEVKDGVRGSKFLVGGEAAGGQESSAILLAMSLILLEGCGVASGGEG